MLGDRPIEITLQRAWEAMPWGTRARLCTDMLRAVLAPAPDVSGPASWALPEGICLGSTLAIIVELQVHHTAG